MTAVDTQVVGTEEQAGQVATRNRRVRIPYDLASARDADGNPIPLDGEGRLTGIPANWTYEHEPLTAKSFTTKTLSYRFRLQKLESARVSLDTKIEGVKVQIHESINGVDPQVQKSRQIERMKSQLQALQAQLKAEGIEM